jgi:hypothetical protein
MFVLLIAILADISSEETQVGKGRGGRWNSEAGCAHSGVPMGKSHFKSAWRWMDQIVTAPFSSSRGVCAGVRNGAFICINIRRMPIHSYVESAINSLKRRR